MWKDYAVYTYSDSVTVSEFVFFALRPRLTNFICSISFLVLPHTLVVTRLWYRERNALCHVYTNLLFMRFLATSSKRALSYTLMSGMTSELHFLSNLSSLQIGPRTVVVWRDCKPRSRSLSRMSPYCLVFLNRTIHLSLISYCLVFFYITVQLPLVAYCLVLFSITTNLPPIAYCLIFFYRITHLPRVAYSIVPFKLKKSLCH